jgi:hypothetical protein
MSPVTVGHTAQTRTNAANTMPRSAWSAASPMIHVPGDAGGGAYPAQTCVFHDLDAATVRGGAVGPGD